MSKSSHMKESLRQRNEAKDKLLLLARSLFKSEKINKPLFNKMWNIASPASAYRLKSINEAIQSLEILKTENNDNQKTKKKDFTTIYKSIKKGYYYKELGLNKFKFYYEPQPNDILTVANKFYSNVNYTLPKNHDYKFFNKDNKKTFNYKFDGDYSEILNLLNDIYSKQKFSFKINISFGFTLISESMNINKDIKEFLVEFKKFDASPNTRVFTHPKLIDNKRDIQNIYNEVVGTNLIDKLTKLRDNSAWKFYEFLYIRFDVYELKTTIGKAQELPPHFKEESNNKCLIKYENYDDYLCFWRCLAYHSEKPIDPRNVNKKLKQLFNDYYKNTKDIKNYNGVEYVAYKEQYNDLNNDEYDNKNDELDLIERFFKININVYTNDEPNELMIDRSSINLFEDSINLLRYNNHIMYIKNMDQVRHCYKCKKCNKIFKCDSLCNRHETKCNILVQHEFKGGIYELNQGIFKNIEIDENDKYYPFEICYDFEAMLKPMNEKNNDTKLKITMEHVPVSVSILSNVPGYDQKPILFVVMTQKH